MAEPSNNGGNSRTDVIAPGQSIVYPPGWLHIQHNDNCESLDTVLVFSAVNSGGTTNLPQALSTFDANYTSKIGWLAAVPDPAPTFWVVDPACAARCGINATSASAPTAKAQFQNKLQQTAGLVFSGEQVAAADASALFGQGAKAALRQDAQLAAKAVRSGAAAAKNATRAVFVG